MKRKFRRGSSLCVFYKQELFRSLNSYSLPDGVWRFTVLWPDTELAYTGALTRFNALKSFHGSVALREALIDARHWVFQCLKKLSRFCGESQLKTLLATRQ